MLLPHIFLSRHVALSWMGEKLAPENSSRDERPIWIFDDHLPLHLSCKSRCLLLLYKSLAINFPSFFIIDSRFAVKIRIDHISPFFCVSTWISSLSRTSLNRSLSIFPSKDSHVSFNHCACSTPSKWVS